MARRRNADLARAIGARARALRRAASLTQEQLAEQVGLQPSAISRFENGAVGLSVTTLLDMSDALGVPLARFFEDPTGAQPPEDADEQALLAQWRTLTEPYRDQLRALLRWAHADLVLRERGGPVYRAGLPERQK
jgi:transcriptional regulator with XRE-family HTH domain